MKRTNKEVTPEQALIKLEDLCARGEYSTGELRQKLYRWGISLAESDKLIAQLIDNRFVDDSRFAKIYARDKVTFARWGRRKIAQGLYTKGIDRALIKETLAQIDEQAYTDNIKHLIFAKIKSDPSLLSTYEGRTKLYRHLLSRGYEPEIAAQQLRIVIANQNLDN